jgi:glycosyltransferase involved in cell wall biosynthesis
MKEMALAQEKSAAFVRRTAATHRVCIIQSVMKQYRVPFFTALEEALAQQRIALTVVYGNPWAKEAERGDNVRLPAPLGHEVKNLYPLNTLLVQPVLKPWLTADLVIVEQANKQALNYVLLALRALGLKRLAFWGHGRDMQADPSSLGERFKRSYLKQVDWWFTYTAGACDYVSDQGFERPRITTVENAVDTRALRDALAAVREAERDTMRRQLAWNADARIAVYCGSLYANKRVDSLITISDAIYAAVPDFRLLIIGGGPEEENLAALARQRPWIRMVGPKFGREKTVLLSLAELWLNPGLVGLGVLDAFCAGLPVLTQRMEMASPELEYIADDHNGYILPNRPEEYVSTVVALLRDQDRLARLRSGARESAERYSIETMVKNFSAGVLACLSRS